MTSRPNILFFFPDQHRYDWLGPELRGRQAADGADLDLSTPHLHRLAESGVSFDLAITPSPVCSPARACLATGREYGRAGVLSNRDNTPTDVPNIYRVLRDRGYQVGAVGKFDLHKPDLDWGLDGQNMLEEYGFTCGCDSEGKCDGVGSYVRNEHRPKGPYLNYLSESGLAEVHLEAYERGGALGLGSSFHGITPLPDEAYGDNWITDQGMDFMRGFKKDQPWFMMFNFTGPHNPFDITESMSETVRHRNFSQPIYKDEAGAHGDEDHLEVRRHYAAMIENIDRNIGRVLALLEERGELENTLIVYSSDHGEMLGDHGRWGKGTWRKASVGVPLIVSGPKVKAGLRSSALVSIHDLAQTFAELSGEPVAGFDGPSMWPLLTGTREEHREWAYSGLDHWRMVQKGSLKMVLSSEEMPQLYDLQEDPEEVNNLWRQLAGEADHQGLLTGDANHQGLVEQFLDQFGQQWPDFKALGLD